MGGFFGGRKAPAPVAPLPPDNSAAEKAAADKAKKARLRAVGRSSTLLTGGLGITEEANQSQVTLGIPGVV